MKGIVFTELIEMVELELGIDIADRMISAADTSHGGAYTSVGTYDHAELIRLVVALSAETGVPVSDLVRSFGRHLFGRFAALYPQFFNGIDSTFQFLPMVQAYIHIEVRKLYPDAELPSFDCHTPECQSTHSPSISGSPKPNRSLVMTYRSARPFADLAEGLILACIDHYDETIHLTREDLGPQDGTQARFTLVETPVIDPCEESIECLT